MDGVGSAAWIHRVVGCVVGSAVGDALGAPFEFGPAGQWSARFPDPVHEGTGEMIGGGGFGWAPGQFTDDTEMAVIVAESLLACGGIDPDDQLERFRAWGTTASDVGNLTREVLGSGLPADQAALHVLRSRAGRHTAGNGSIMRAAPGAVHFAAAGREATMAAAHRLSAVTHADPLCRWAVAIQHELVRCLLEGTDLDTAVAGALDALPPDVARVYVPLLEPGWVPSPAAPSNGSAMGALAQAVWAMRSHSTFEQVLAAVIDLGDDTDSVAAVAGALAGARVGVGAVPVRWQQVLHGHVTGVDGRSHRYDVAALRQLALALVGAVDGEHTSAPRRGAPVADEIPDDGPFAAAIAAVGDGQWARLRNVLDELSIRPPGWPEHADEARVLMDLLYEMGLVVPFDWPTWFMTSRFHGGVDGDVSMADTVRLITVFLRADRFSEGEFGTRIADGTLPRLLEGLLAGVRPA